MELAANLERQRRRVGAACAAVGRDPGEVTIVVVTKTFPASDVVHLAGLGVADVGENRDQEAAAKAVEVTAAGIDVRWHFVGQVQRNKAKSVVRYAEVVHSVDSTALAQALARAADRFRERPLDVLVQVSIDGDPARGGAPVGGSDPSRDALAVAAECAAHPSHLRLRGVMAVAPTTWPADRAFGLLASVAARIRAAHPAADWVSAGMSGDLEAAVAAGATHVRLGAAILGNRTPPAVA